eukprot:765059-Hanusia_phi.AAC.1
MSGPRHVQHACCLEELDFRTAARARSFGVEQQRLARVQPSEDRIHRELRAAHIPRYLEGLLEDSTPCAVLHTRRRYASAVFYAPAARAARKSRRRAQTLRLVVQWRPAALERSELYCAGDDVRVVLPVPQARLQRPHRWGGRKSGRSNIPLFGVGRDEEAFIVLYQPTLRQPEVCAPRYGDADLHVGLDGVLDVYP